MESTEKDSTRQAGPSPDDRVAIGAWGAVPVGIAADGDCPRIALRCYVVLASYQGQNASCWPSLDTVSRALGVSVKSVGQGLRWLTDNGWVVKTRRGLGKTNVYRVLYPVEPDRGEGVQPDCTPGVQTGSDPTGSTTTPIDNTNLQHQGVRAFPKPGDGLPFADDFGRWWRRYPNKRDRKAAHRKYVATRRKGATADELERALTLYLQDERVLRGYPKMGATFLGPDEHWRDILDNPPEPPMTEEEREVEDLVRRAVN